MLKGKLYEGLEHAGETSIHKSIVDAVNEAKEEFLKLDPITDDALLDSIYDWFLKYFGEVK